MRIAPRHGKPPCFLLAIKFKQHSLLIVPLHFVLEEGCRCLVADVVRRPGDGRGRVHPA